MPNWRNMPSMPKVRDFVRHDRHDMLADRLVAQQRVEDAHERHGGGDLASPLLFSCASKAESGGIRSDCDFRRRAGRKPPSAARAPADSAISGLSSAKLRERYFLELFVGDRQAEAVAELA